MALESYNLPSATITSVLADGSIVKIEATNVMINIEYENPSYPAPWETGHVLYINHQGKPSLTLAGEFEGLKHTT